MSKEDSFVSIEDLTEEDWAFIETLAKQVVKTGVFKENMTRSSIAAFVLWLSDSKLGIAIEEPKRKKKHAKLSDLH